MSERIDVLAVMDAAVGQANGVALDHSGSVVLAKHRDDMREARAAVAELVEADKEYDAASKGYNPLFASRAEVDRYQAAVARRSAALARIAPNELHDKAAELRGRGE